MKKVALFLAAGALALVATSPAEAACSSGLQFSQAGAGGYFYTNFGPQDNANYGAMVGRLWQAGARSSGNENGTSCPINSWLQPFGDRWYISGFQTGGDPQGEVCDVAGCITGDMIALIQTTTTDGGSSFGVARQPSDLSAAIIHDFSLLGSDINMVKVPRPRVVSSTRAGGTVNLNLTIDDVNAGCLGAACAVSSIQIVTATGTADPGRSPANWVVAQTLTNAAGPETASLAADCTNPSTDVFVATRLVFDGGQQLGDFVSASTRVNCNPALADPDKGFKVIDRKSGTKREATIK